LRFLSHFVVDTGEKNRFKLTLLQARAFRLLAVAADAVVALDMMTVLLDYVHKNCINTAGKLAAKKQLSSALNDSRHLKLC